MSIRRFFMLGLLIGHPLGWLASPLLAQAVSSGIVISELQMAGTGTGHSNEEFIELYNASDQAISIDKWAIKYHANSVGDCASGWTSKYVVGAGTIAAHGYWLVSSTAFIGAADGHFAYGLASAAGAIRLIDNAGSTVDAVAWGNGNTCGEGTAVAAVPDGHSLERRPGEDQALSGNGVDTDNNFDDFFGRVAPESQSSLSPTELPSAENAVASAPTVYLPLEITELLVDPVSPATDAQDEYIELYNPNPEPVQAAGYVLKSSTASFHLLAEIIPPNGYTKVLSAQSRLSLSNTGGSLELLDPAGNVLNQVAPWPVASPGNTWAVFEDGWRWTTQPTPAAVNIRVDLEETAAAVNVTPAQVGSYLPVRLSEIFPDPAAPLVDSADEFVELYNPNSETVDLSGYELKTGSNLGNSVALSDITIEPLSYVVITSGDTALTLSNSGSSVQLLDPAGEQQDLTTYPEAKVGLSWILIDGSWAWTATVTSGASNVLAAEIPVVAPVKSSTKVVKTPVVKAVKAAKIASPKPQAAVKKSSASAKPLVAASSTPANNRWLLFVLVGLTIGYIIYEFRYDLRNYYYRLRSNSKVSR